MNVPTLIVGSDAPHLPAAPTNHLQRQRDLDGKLGTLDAAGRVVVAARFGQTRPDMEDLTQIGSLSPTQQNSESAYEQFARRVSVDTRLAAGVLGEEGSERAHAGHDSLLAKQHSVITDSTVVTYTENDTGHVRFDEFVADENLVRDNSVEREESMSQDAPYVPKMLEFQPYEPQTPAPPINPFSHKGSVLKTHEMFRATQPSSIGRLMTSAASSRPSPDVYNDFTSPAKWAPPSSPLARHLELVGTSPLQSSVRTLLRSRSIDPPKEATTLMAPGAHSFDTSPRFPLESSVRAPLEYVSMKESQERRRKDPSPSPQSDTESESDLDDIPTIRQRERRHREKEIQRQLSTVELHKHATTSSGSISPSPGDIEVPSTSNRRRRSIQEDYIAQCEGTDARDTQQDDVIMDSQAVTDNAIGCGQLRVATSSKDTTAPSQNPSGPDSPDITASPSFDTSCNGAELEPVPDLDANMNSDQTSSAPKCPGSPFQQPSLPLDEVSSNRNDLRTPLVAKTQVFSDGAGITIPETSPPEGHIRPMGEITNISFGESNTQELQGLPGFTQDTEFENAIRPRSSPDSAPKPTKTRRNIPFPSFAPTMEARDISSEATEERTEVRKAVATENQLIVSPATSSLERPMPSSTSISKTMLPDAQTVVAIIHSPRVVAGNGETTVTEDGSELENQLNGLVESVTPQSTKGDSLRSAFERKGPSRALRRSSLAHSAKPFTTPQPSRVMKLAGITKASPTPSSDGALVSSPAPPSPISSTSSIPTPRSIVTRSSTQKAREKTVAPIAASQMKVMKPKACTRKTPSLHAERLPKRKATMTDDTMLPKRASKRQLISRESSADPLSLSLPLAVIKTQTNLRLFSNMAFAVSYNDQEQEKDAVATTITEGGGSILEDGFDSLFESASGSKSRAQSGAEKELVVSPSARKLGFVALIADKHSRKVKYMQALALGLPCISGRWITECIAKNETVDWAPYLLCAGQSSFLGNAIRSRTLQPYPAATASFPETFVKRAKLLGGKSILVISGRSSAGGEKRRYYRFLTRVLGPARIEQVTDLEQAREVLLDSIGQRAWDLIYVDDNVEHADKVLFGQPPTAGAGSRKRKKGHTVAKEKPTPEKVRIISDQDVIQSLILGQWME